MQHGARLAWADRNSSCLHWQIQQDQIHSLTTGDQAGLSASDMVIMQSCFCRDLLVASFSKILLCWSPDWTETICVCAPRWRLSDPEERFKLGDKAFELGHIWEKHPLSAQYKVHCRANRSFCGLYRKLDCSVIAVWINSPVAHFAFQSLLQFPQLPPVTAGLTLTLNSQPFDPFCPTAWLGRQCWALSPQAKVLIRLTW